jgi:two-component sensor histidine kinase
VSDNGIGLPEYVDFRNSPSLGLTLINSLVKQLEGTIELRRGAGTNFTITFRQ